MSRYCSKSSSSSQALYRAFVVAVLLTATSACSPKQKVSNFYKASTGEELLIHRVDSVEENLRLIALWYTGSAFKEAVIRQNNPQLGASLRVGDFVAIPRDVLLQSEPLPVAFIDSQKAEPVKPKTAVKAGPSSQSRRTVPVRNSKSSPAAQAKPQQNAPEANELTGSVQQTVVETPQRSEETPPAREPGTSPNPETAPEAELQADKKESETLEDQLLKNLLTDN